MPGIVLYDKKNDYLNHDLNFFNFIRIIKVYLMYNGVKRIKIYLIS